ncbi:hypothetical protein Taro_040326 [Colocasia esculenta]|uniref:Uncharacterized protein n=1 Tax=Colocasia esculenta TaxID=4460 RepID=A0A843WIS2_COLES|nr:hypothetical protein [Colocasia esculenta]
MHASPGGSANVSVLSRWRRRLLVDLFDSNLTKLTIEKKRKTNKEMNGITLGKASKVLVVYASSTDLQSITQSRKMPPKSKFKIITSLYNKNTPTATFIPQNRLAPNPPSGKCLIQWCPRGFYENRDKQFSIQFDGQQIHVEERRPSSLIAQEKAIATCEERNFTSSLDPSILTYVLDAVYHRNHGGFERGCGLGWSRVA